MTPLMWASASGNLEVVQQLLERGAIVDRRAADGTTALMLASANGFAETVRALLGRGADVTAARAASRRVNWHSIAATPTSSRCSSVPRLWVAGCWRRRPKATIRSFASCLRPARRQT